MKPEPRDKAEQRPVSSEKGSPAAGVPRHKAVEQPRPADSGDRRRDASE